MANQDDVVNSIQSGANQITNGINSASSQVNEALNDINSAIQDLGDGLKLNTRDDKKNENDQNEKQLLTELQGLRNFSEDWRQILDLLLDINISLESTRELLSEGKSEELSEESEDEAVEIKNSRDVNDLAGLTKITDITATGFTIVGNLLSDMLEVFDSIMTNISNGDVGKEFLKSLSPETIDEKKEQVETKQEDSKGVLKGFFEGIAGPLESIAGGLMMIALAMTVLSTLQIGSEMIATLIIFTTFFVMTFAALNYINLQYIQYQYLFDEEGEQGNVLSIMKQFALIVGLVSATMMLVAITVQFMQDNWPLVLGGLVVVFGLAFVTLISLNIAAVAVSNLIGAEKPQEMPIMQLMKSFTFMVLMLVGLSLICALLFDTIQKGMEYASIIMWSAMSMIFVVAGVMMLLEATGVTKEQIQAFTNLVNNLIIMIGVVAVLTIILGVLPESIITQGLIAMTLIMVLIDSMLLMLAISLQKVEKVNAAQLQALMGILIVTTVMITVLSVLVIILGSIELSTIVQGLLTLVVISAIPIVLINLMAKIGQQSGKMAQALLGVAMASIITIAVSAVAWVIISMLGGFEAGQVLTTVMAVTLVTLLLIAVSGAAFIIGTLATPLSAMFPLAMLGVGMASILTVAIAGVAVLISVMLPMERAQAAIEGATAVILTTTALALIAGVALLLAGVAIPLVASVGLALLAVASLVGFIGGLTLAIIAIESIIPILASLGTESLITTTETIQIVMSALVPMALAIVEFGILALTLTAGLMLATAGLLGFTISFVAFSFTYIGFINLIDRLQQRIGEKTASFETFNESLNVLQEFADSLNSFSAPSAESLKSIDDTMNFLKSFAKKFSQLGSTGNINRVAQLANSLANLAQQASGLQDLAAAMNAVAEASQKLQDIPENINTGNLENLTEGRTDSVRIDRIETAQAESEKSGGDDAVAELLRQLIDSVVGVQEVLKDIHSQKEFVARKAANVRSVNDGRLSEFIDD